MNDTSTVEELLARRAKHLPKATSLHYRRPLHIVRGEGAYLFEPDGTRYLDCINNVSHVGHANPRVAEAACRQMRLLNTNARFLYDELFDYVEQLTATLPEPLSVCFLVNSGSEANELALRLARSHTRRRGIVVLDGAYHGNTTSLIDISPYKFDGTGGEGRPAHVQVAATPDPYDGRFRGQGSGADYAADVSAALDRATQQGYPAGAFIAESLLGCAGQVDPPSGYLDAAHRAARAAGAVCIADEVQIGFGRMGDSFWGFESPHETPHEVLHSHARSDTSRGPHETPHEVLHSQARSDTSRGPHETPHEVLRSQARSDTSRGPRPESPLDEQGVVPDIVTLGKPIGNGHPLGAVVTTPEIADSFANGMEYFNTFGGNPVSCVVGSEVLDIIKDEGLQEHARVVGEHLARGFADLATRHTVVGNSRGRGLFRGVALVTDRESHTPATELARDLVQRLREDEQILLSLEGPGDNVLKLKPPMVFSRDDADHLLEALDRTLTAVDA